MKPHSVDPGARNKGQTVFAAKDSRLTTVSWWLVWIGVSSKWLGYQTGLHHMMKKWCFKSSTQTDTIHTPKCKQLTRTVEFDMLPVLLTTVDKESKVVFRETLSIYCVGCWVWAKNIKIENKTQSALVQVFRWDGRLSRFIWGCLGARRRTDTAQVKPVLGNDWRWGRGDGRVNVNRNVFDYTISWLVN